MTSKIKFGIIGCSTVAKKSVIPAIIQSKNAELKSIGSRKEYKAKKIAKEFSCDSFGTYEEVINDDQIDAVYISLPIALQAKFALKAINANKNVLCEKTAAYSYKEARKIVNGCKKNNVRFLEAFMFQFHPQQKKIIELLQKNEIGKVFCIHGNFGFNLKYSKNNFRFNKKLGGGILNDVGCYIIRTCQLYFKENPHSIICKLNEKNNIDVNGSFKLFYRNGKIGSGIFSYSDYFQSNYSIWGKDGRLSVERAYNIKENMNAKIILEKNDKIKKIKIKAANHYKLMIEDFCSEIINPDSSYFDYEDSFLQQASIMDAAHRSNRTNKIIKI